ncbi:MAG: hypothetical protein ACRDRH_18555 [Pseudonocardia sp.]
MQNPRQRGQDDPRPDVDDDPIDLAALRADDALIDALAAGHRQPPANPNGSDDLLVTVLAAWATDVASDRLPPEQSPMPIDSASDPVQSRPTAARHPYLLRLTAAAVLVIMALSGMAVQARDAEPGDTLWGMSTVFYAERARSVAAAVDVEVRLERVRVALREGHPEIAMEELEAVRAQLPVIREDERRDGLAQQEQQLSGALADTSRVAPTGTERPTESTDAVRADARRTAREPAPPAAAAPATEPGPLTAAATATPDTGPSRGTGAGPSRGTDARSSGGTGSTNTAPAPEKPTSPPGTTEPAPTATNSPAPTTEPPALDTLGEAGRSDTPSPESTDPDNEDQPAAEPEDRPDGPPDDSSGTG